MLLATTSWTVLCVYVNSNWNKFLPGKCVHHVCGSIHASEDETAPEEKPRGCEMAGEMISKQQCNTALI